MSDALPAIYLARHGETAWTVSHFVLDAASLSALARAERARR